MISTERLFLRQWQLEDAEAALPLYSDLEVIRYLGGPRRAADLAAVQRTLGKFVEHQQQHSFALWAVVERSSGFLIGVCGLHRFNEIDELEIGYRLLPSYWRKGYAGEASRACLQWGATNLGSRRIIGISHIENLASKHLLEKLGFRWERQIADYRGRGDTVDLYSRVLGG